MPRDIQIVDTCDVCFDEGNEHEPAHETPPISIAAVKPRTLLLCERHEKELVTRLRDLLMEHGEISRGSGRKKATSAASESTLPRVAGDLLDCPIKNCPYANESRVNVATHVRHVHNTTLAEFETKMGQTIDGQPLRVTCPDCGLGYPHGAGMSAHRRTEHGYDPRAVTAQPEEEDPTLELEESPAAAKKPPKKIAKKAPRKRVGNLGA